MLNQSMRARLSLSYAAIALLAALSLGSIMLLVLDQYYSQKEREVLFGDALSLQPSVEQVLQNDAAGTALQDLVEAYSFLIQARIRVLDPEGQVMADSGVPSTDQLVSISGTGAEGVILSLPAVAPHPDGTAPGAGLSATVGTVSGVTTVGMVPGATELVVSATLYGYDLGSSGMSDPGGASRARSSEVVRVGLSGSLGSLEISSGPAYGRDILRSVSLAWAGAGLLAIGLAALVGGWASRWMTRPVLVLAEATRRMQAGDLTTRVNLSDTHPAREVRALGALFNDMARRLEETVSTLRSFVADAAHELHTPLTALHTNLELLEEEPAASRRRLYLQRAREQAGRLEELVSGLLDLSRIEAAGKALGSEVLCLQPLLRELADQYGRRARGNDQAFSLDETAPAVQVRAEAAKVRRILINLLENALKFTPPGGSIRLGLEVEGRQAVISVADTGIGIPVEDQPGLFERFHRGRNASRYPGSGLGLAIVRALVESSGGSVTAESPLVGGTRMVVRLPLAE